MHTISPSSVIQGCRLLLLDCSICVIFASKQVCLHFLTHDSFCLTGQILEKTDYTMISGNPFIKKSGWRKISFYFNLSYEIRDKTIEFDENRNVQRAEFVIRAYMQGGRFSDGWGSCERREKRFSKPNHDIPSTAETRAKNRASQDLLGIGEYRPGASRAP